MKIYEDYSSTYDDAIDHYWDLKKFSTESDDTAAFIGWAYMDKISDHIDTIRKYQNAVYFNTEHPCVFQGTDESSIALSSDSNKLFNKIIFPLIYSMYVSQRSKKCMMLCIGVEYIMLTILIF